MSKDYGIWHETFEVAPATFPEDDLISRKAAIDKAEEWIEAVYCDHDEQRERDAIKHVINRIKKLPSKQPERIIRCRECEWWDKKDNSLYGYCMAMKHGFNSNNWEIGIYRQYKGDFYCADAERRTDEQT